jgi:hypothetical protein
MKSRQEEALRLKELGNSKFTEGQYEVAIDLYTSALSVCLLSYAKDRAILYANRAAARVRMVCTGFLRVRCRWLLSDMLCCLV